MVSKVKALLLTGALAISGCVWLAGNRVPVYNVLDAPLSTTRTEAQVGEVIGRAARIYGSSRQKSKKLNHWYGSSMQ